MRRPPRPALLPLLVVVLAGCGPRAFDVKGRVAGFSDDRSKLFVEHEAIPGFMDAMTMPFTLAPGEALPDGLTSGDAVGFRLEVAREASVIRSVRRLPDDAVARHPAGEVDAPAPTGDPRTRPLAVGDPVPDVGMTDHTGGPVSLADYRGKAVLVTFIYTRCPLPDYCPRLSAGFQALQAPLRERFGDRAALLTVSFDPARDTPEVLRTYRARYTTAPDSLWRFAVPPPAGVEPLVAPFGVFVDAKGATFDHGLTTALVGPDGVLRRTWRDAAYTPAEIVREVALVLPPAP